MDNVPFGRGGVHFHNIASVFFLRGKRQLISFIAPNITDNNDFIVELFTP